MSNKVSPEDEKRKAINYSPQPAAAATEKGKENNEGEIAAGGKPKNDDPTNETQQWTVSPQDARQVSFGSDKTKNEAGVERPKTRTRGENRNQILSQNEDKSNKNEQNAEERRLSKAEEKRIHDDFLKKEDEFKKKLAYHHHDKADIVDSEESICIAAPPPANRMSVVRLVMCGAKSYKKCLFVCAAFQFVSKGFSANIIVNY